MKTFNENLNTVEDSRARKYECSKETEPAGLEEEKMNSIIGTNTRCYPSEEREEMVCLTIVLVAGAIGDYAVYIGEGSPRWVARHGDKLFFDEAILHFPGLGRENYRL